MNSDEQTSPPTVPTSSSPSFDDLPVYELLEKDVNSMTPAEQQAFVANLRSLRNAQHLRARLNERTATPRTSKTTAKSEPVPDEFNAQTLMDNLLKDL